MKEKKKRKRLKKILPFICATLLLLGSSVTVFAAYETEIPYSNYSISMLKQIAIDSGLVDDMSDYKYMTVLYSDSDMIFVYITSEPLYTVTATDSSSSRLILDSELSVSYCISIGHDWVYNESTYKEYIDDSGYSFLMHCTTSFFTVATRSTDDDLRNYILYSNYDICTSDGSLFFQQPLPVVPKAIQAAQLPEVIQKQITIILPIAVGCLALVIGSIVLLPRLRNFLAG